MIAELSRLARRADPTRVPRDGETGMFVVDATCGVIQPLYYRGGIYDWVRLGLPLDAPTS